MQGAIDGAGHVEADADGAADEVFAGLDGSGVVAVFPEGTLSILSIEAERVLTGPELVAYIRNFGPERPRPVEWGTVRANAALKDWPLAGPAPL